MPTHGCRMRGRSLASAPLSIRRASGRRRVRQPGARRFCGRTCASERRLCGLLQRSSCAVPCRKPPRG
ncbi:hypothetical protein ELH42_09060 [Rhizobium ruizarguesonis]|uniref:Uncharacterized protein n=1 Tax=Rhizobium ruizarguesonis TaxID=2081791 RepID=A0AB38I4E2_9HYPH|nr:hypothetical protein ELH85_10210 [Rhizobium ruizarguesonis]TCA70466.1 hypothetical protein E0H69_25565 [Rhizobium leguminosarum bv. viciae]TAZ78154.1 hypothetical protein ELH68_10410 [Rhizobium ruizarguesonis]TBA04531.1 hypothetical protein ELH64_08970 [Rhizobium ruizarguesonis]TBA25939.1 hypothetical protein ELH61_09105 [Rhizobium ruizarguesonis]